ncbi:MAG: PAS domain-containing protein, partial [Chloroflexota bacterium]
MQQPKDKRPSFHMVSLNLAVGLLVILLASLLLAGLIISQVRSGQSDFSLMVLLLGVLALGSVSAVMLVFDVRRQAGASSQNETELRRQNADLVRANNDLQSQLSGRASELADERTQSKTILQSMSEAVVVVDAERVRYSNRALTRLTGFSGDDLTSKLLTAPDAVSLAGQLAHLREIVSAAIAQ